MRIATWNIAGGHQYTGNHRYSERSQKSQYGYAEKENVRYFTNQLQQVRPDIVMLQEVHRHKQTGQAQSDAIALSLGHKATNALPYSNSHIEDNYSLSLATLTKDPGQTYFHELPHLDLQIVRPNGDTWVSFAPTGFLISHLIHEGKPITVVNTHLHPFHYFERDFSEPEFQGYRNAISKFLLSLKDTPTLIAGDFNYADLQKLFPDVFKEGGFTDTFRADTTPFKGQQDHILYSHHWKLNEVSIRRGFADHYLCSADLSLGN